MLKHWRSSLLQYVKCLALFALCVKYFLRRAYFCLFKQHFERKTFWAFNKKFLVYIKETKKRSAYEILYAKFKQSFEIRILGRIHKCWRQCSTHWHHIHSRNTTNKRYKLFLMKGKCIKSLQVISTNHNY